jgi:hypothetical protein
MDGETLVAAIRDAKATELARLSSDRRLLAVTGPDLTKEQVLVAAAGAERAAAETFAIWADETEHDEVRDIFEAVARAERDHLNRVRTAAEEPIDPGDDPGAFQTHLRGLTDPVERVAAGLVGRPLVSSGTQLQFVNFFVNEADGARADLFRELRRETDEQLAMGTSLLETLCEARTDWDRASRAAETAVDVAYEEYADALRGLGIDPKPVC